MAMLNQGSLICSSSASHARPASLSASSASISSGVRPSANAASTPVSIARRASRRSSASGLQRITSMPATICAMCWSGMSGRAPLQNSLKVMYAP